MMNTCSTESVPFYAVAREAVKKAKYARPCGPCRFVLYTEEKECLRFFITGRTPEVEKLGLVVSLEIKP
jgi:hypothetical protein